jgi:hypothetical protein
MSKLHNGVGIMGGVLILLSAGSASAQALSPIEQYWATFGQGDIEEAVSVVLDAASATILDTTLNDAGVVLEWDAATDTWELTLDGVPVGDVTTDADEWNRPTFAALYDGNGVPTLTGFADVDNNGILVVQWDEFGYQTLRMQVTDGLPIGMTKCICGGTGGTVTRECKKEDCDTAEQCREGGGGVGLGYCKWNSIAVGGVN